MRVRKEEENRRGKDGKGRRTEERRRRGGKIDQRNRRGE